LEEIGIPELTPEQVEELCEVAERAAREHILSRVPLHQVSNLSVSVDITGSRPVTVDVELEVALSPLVKDRDVKNLAEEAKDVAFSAVEKHLRALACRSGE